MHQRSKLPNPQSPLAKPPAAGRPSPVQRPWISINLAVSCDGRIAAAAGSASGWTSNEDHQRLLELRRGVDALLVGRATLVADRMTLTVPDQDRQPLRCIASRSGSFDPQHPLFHRPGGPIHLLAATWAAATPPPGAILHCGTFAKFLTTLAVNHHVKTLHCEGGGGVIASLAGLDAIDEVHLTLAGHTLFGNPAAPTITGIPGNFLPHSMPFDLTRFDPRPDLGECFVSYTRYGAKAPQRQ
jgi:2,5-diamino-6-(ribosylamino)-4(3H)-pyrimidinone 5'-phosphate reductase